MVLKLTVNDARNVARGRCSMRLNFGSNQWSIEDDQTKAWSSVGFSTKGSFEVKDWGVIWIWDEAQQPKRNTVIIWDAPKGESDSAHAPGRARMYDPKDSSLKDSTISWTVDTAQVQQQMAPIRQKILEICSGVLPATIGTLLTPGQGNMTRISGQKHSAHGETNCGVFPGWIAKQIPGGSGLVPERLEVPAYTLKDGKVVDKSYVSVGQPITEWEAFALNVEKIRKLSGGTIWVPYDKNHSEIRPQPADFYVLSQTPGGRKFAHVGVMIDSSSDPWITADCGQGGASAAMEPDPNDPEPDVTKKRQRHKFDKGLAAGYQHRKFNPADGSIRGEFGGAAWLKGWVNVVELFKGWKP